MSRAEQDKTVESSGTKSEDLNSICVGANCTFYPQTPADPRHVPRVCVLSRQTAAPPQLEPEYFLYETVKLWFRLTFRGTK